MCAPQRYGSSRRSFKIIAAARMRPKLSGWGLSGFGLVSASFCGQAVVGLSRSFGYDTVKKKTRDCRNRNRGPCTRKN
jgi:hypothetical protein